MTTSLQQLQRVLVFLQGRGWNQTRETPHFFVYVPPAREVAPQGYELFVPRNPAAADFVRALDNCIEAIGSFYKAAFTSIEALRPLSERSHPVQSFGSTVESEERRGSRIFAQDALALFVGMLYAAMLSHVLFKAMEGSLFDDGDYVVILFSLLIFFSYDWITRSIANQLTPFPQTPNVALFLKLAVDVAVVFFLLLTSLKLLELLSSKQMPLQAAVDPQLLRRLCWLSIASWFWNMVVIWHASILTKAERGSILTLVLPRPLLRKYFPKIGEWQERVENAIVAIDVTVGTDITGHRVLSGMWWKQTKANARATCLVMAQTARNLPRLLTPYLLLLKFVGLDLVLGIVLLLVYSRDPSRNLWNVPWPLFVFALVGLFVLYSWHLSPRPITGPPLERLSAAALCFFLFLVYAILSPTLLAITVVLQQIVAGSIMLLDFKIPLPERNAKPAIVPQVKS